MNLLIRLTTTFMAAIWSVRVRRAKIAALRKRVTQMVDAPPNRAAQINATVTGDPRFEPYDGNPLDDGLNFRRVFLNLQSAPRSIEVTNWDLFEGTVLSVIFSTKLEHRVLGSAVMVAPGVALTATHVIDDHVSKLEAGTMSGALFGITSRGGVAWKITHRTEVPNSDLCILGLQYVVALPADRVFRLAYLTTRTPMLGERLIVAGFRAGANTFPTDVERNQIVLSGALLICSGDVIDVYPKGRDRVLAPWPCVTINCPAWGGMSGGPVFDMQGRLVGLISRSMETFDEPSPTLSMLLWPALVTRFAGGWPFRHDGKCLLEVQPPIERPDAFKFVRDEPNKRFEVTYSPWT
jgi:Trypsin-like peptidase domain